MKSTKTKIELEFQKFEIAQINPEINSSLIGAGRGNRGQRYTLTATPPPALPGDPLQVVNPYTIYTTTG